MNTIPDLYPAVLNICPSCKFYQHPVGKCVDVRCCYAWQRREVEGRRRSEERNGQEREEDKG